MRRLSNEGSPTVEEMKKSKNSFRSKHGKLALKILIGVGLVAVIVVVLLKVHFLKKKNVEVIITVHGDEDIAEPKTTTHPKARHQKSKELSQQWQNIRLPKDVMPEKYHMSLEVDMNKEVYNGTVNIKVNVLNDTQLILLHQSGLILHTVAVTNETQGHETIESRRSEPKFEYHVIKMVSALRAGKTYNIRIEFSNTIRNDLGGFFISQRQNSKLAATFFSPINARTAFPCFDEPSFKALFTLSITNSLKYNALSNMEVESTTTSGNRRTTTFKETVRMATYTFAWVIHDDTYQYVERKSTNGLVIKAWYFKDELKNLDRGLNATVKMLEFYEKFFDSKFPLSKLDVTVQPYFVPSAMENWGLMTFRKNRYIFYQKDDSFNYVFGNSIIGHEMVHQWFGNLATMEFWNEAWLKEGFANYIGIYGVQKVDPSIPIGDLIYTTYMADALELDAFSTSHSLTPTLKTNSAIREVFDTITYNKGSCMVQMLQKFLGEEAFKLGLQAFLKKYQYKNANQQGLWQVLGETSGVDVKSFMKEWTEVKGYPLLKVNRINDTHVKIEQEPFLQDQVKPKPTTLWKVLITYKSLTKPTSGSYLLTGKSGVFEIPRDAIINPNHDLYYRVKYGPTMTADLVYVLIAHTTDMTTLDRTGLISDQLNIMGAQQASLSETWQYIKYLVAGSETHNGPWNEAVKHFMMIYDILEDSAAKSKWSAFVQRHFVLPKLNQYDMAACKLNSSYYINAVSDPSIKMSGTLLCCSFKTASSHLMWDIAFKNFVQSRDTALLEPLTCTKDVKRIEKVLQYTMNTSYLHADYATWTLGNIAKKSHRARDTTWKFVKSRWSEFMARYNDDLYYLNELIYGVVPLFSTQAQLQDVETFFNSKELGTATQAVQQTISQIKMKISYKTYMANQINNFL